MHPTQEVIELRQAREEGEFTRAQLARRLSISPQMLQRIEEGEKSDYPEGFLHNYRTALLQLDAERRERLLAAVGRPSGKPSRKSAPATETP